MSQAGPSDLCQDVREVDEDAVALGAEPVMRAQEVQVPCAVVDGDCHRHRKGVLPVRARAARSRGKFDTRVVLALKFVLVLRNELQVPHIVQDDAIMGVPVKGAHPLWEDVETPHFELQRALEQGLHPLCFPCLGGPVDDEQWIA